MLNVESPFVFVDSVSITLLNQCQVTSYESHLPFIVSW
jgi:hypothetical protein